jgi:DNA-binding transcriptional MerR regulator
MHTIAMLRRTLGLSSDNQVRNRIERIKDLLSEHVRRGPNNQIFLTDSGLDLLKQFQELYDSGLTLTEASHVIRASSQLKPHEMSKVSSRLVLNDTKPDQPIEQLAAALSDELSLLRKQIASLASSRASCAEDHTGFIEPLPWWSHLREDLDVT